MGGATHQGPINIQLYVYHTPLRHKFCQTYDIIIMYLFSMPVQFLCYKIDRYAVSCAELMDSYWAVNIHSVFMFISMFIAFTKIFFWLLFFLQKKLFAIIIYFTVATNLEYSGISLNMKNSGNSVQPQEKIVTNKVFLVRDSNICVKQLLTG